MKEGSHLLVETVPVQTCLQKKVSLHSVVQKETIRPLITLITIAQLSAGKFNDINLMYNLRIVNDNDYYFSQLSQGYTTYSAKTVITPQNI